MDITTYASYGVFRAIVAEDERVILVLEPEFTPLDLSYINGYRCFCN